MRRSGYCGIAVLLAAPLLGRAVATGPVLPYEVLGASPDWVVVRQNITVLPDDKAPCNYPGLDGSEYVGATVHFLRLPAEARRGRLMPVGKPDRSWPLYAPNRDGHGCTSVADAERIWKEVVEFAKSLGVGLTVPRLTPLWLGDAIPAKACVLAENPAPCRRNFSQAVNGATFRIAISLTAVPEAPDLKTCQFPGLRFGAALQVAGLNFGKPESGVAPGGFADHYDCRSQQFDPLRLYRFDSQIVLLGGFRGTNIADHDEYPFLVIFPGRP